jgi:cob(I)alamin adenosyltransferase
MKIYTKKGDKGMTALFGGKRVCKDDVRVNCYGTLDEVNSTIGLLRVKLGNEVSALCHVVRTQLSRGERLLVTIMREDEVEDWIPAYINRLSDLLFILARAEMDKAGVAEEKWQLFLYKKISRQVPSPPAAPADQRDQE